MCLNVLFNIKKITIILIRSEKLTTLLNLIKHNHQWAVLGNMGQNGFISIIIALNMFFARVEAYVCLSAI